MRTKQHDLPKPDHRGRIRPYVGRMANGNKARFTVGDKRTSPAEALRRLTLIRTLYERQCERFKGDFWREWTRQVAVKIASGSPITDQCIGGWDDPRYTAGVVAQLRAWGIPVQVTAPDEYAEGLDIHADEITQLVAKLVADELAKQQENRGAVADVATLPNDPLSLAETATLFQALDHRRKHLKETARRDQNGKLVARAQKCMDRVRYLKEHHDNMPLWKLDLPAIERMVAYWRNRPLTRKGNRCSKIHATDMLKELWRFFGWLEDQPNYRWEKPKGIEKVNRAPVGLPEDDRKGAFQTNHKQTYTPDQLGTIVPYADDLGKAIIGVCVNCAFGASEIGQWNTANFQIHTPHPHADKLGIETSGADSWVVGYRPKTGVYGEHLLWGKVASVVSPLLDGRPVLPILKTGDPWYRTHRSNPQTKFFNWWKKLIEAVQTDHPDFPYYPFGVLRDILPDILRSRYTDSVASIALQHGKTSDDDLLKCYANTPFGQLFKATRELEAHFKPFLDTLPL